MNTKLALILALAWLGVFLNTAQNNPSTPKPTVPPKDKVEQEVVMAEQTRVTALLSKDDKRLRNLLSDDYVQVRHTGEIRRKAHILQGLKDGTLQFASIELTNSAVFVHGNAAVVVGMVNRKGREGTLDLTGTFRFTRTWVKKEGQWVLASMHMSKMEKK